MCNYIDMILEQIYCIFLSKVFEIIFTPWLELSKLCHLPLPFKLPPCNNNNGVLSTTVCFVKLSNSFLCILEVLGSIGFPTSSLWPFRPVLWSSAWLAGSYIEHL